MNIDNLIEGKLTLVRGGLLSIDSGLATLNVKPSLLRYVDARLENSCDATEKQDWFFWTKAKPAPRSFGVYFLRLTKTKHDQDGNTKV